MEEIPNLEEKSYDLSYEKTERRHGVDVYTFNKVAIAIDTSGKNYQKLPEVLFGTFENSPDEGNALNQPEKRREGVNMDYISACLKKISEDTNIHEFWFDPYSKDEHPEARLRLFRRFVQVTPAPEGHGYIVQI
jgi:hypothetical protein